MKRLASLGMLGYLCACAAASAEPVRRITNEDFARSDRFLLGNPDRDVLNGNIHFQWIGQGSSFYYRSQSATATRYLRVESATGKKKPLFDHAAMAAALSKVLNRPASATALPIQELTRLDDHRYRVLSEKKAFACDLQARTCTEEKADNAAATSAPSPDGRHALFLRDYNLWLRRSGDGTERRLTHDGKDAWSYAREPESSTFEIANRRSGRSPAVAALWSPDGRRFVSYQLDERHVAELALVQAVPEDGSFRPKLHTYRYELLGERPSEAAFFVYDIEKNSRTPIAHRPLPATYRVPITTGHLWWSPDGRKLYVIDADITKPVVTLLEVNPDSGAARVLMEERADTTYFPNVFVFGPPNIRILSNGDIVWFSERSGWGHLYRYDGRTGKLKNAITQGDWLVMDILRIDERAGYIYFSGCGREKGEDPYNRHLYRVKLDGTRFELLTPAPGDHDLPALWTSEIAGTSTLGKYLLRPSPISPNGEYLIDHFSSANAPGRWLLRRKDGSVVAQLEEENASALPPYTAPEPFVVKSADGSYDLYGVLSKPADFDPGKRYPVVDEIYPGPLMLWAPKTFAGGGNPTFGGSTTAIFGRSQALADLGFVVIRVDGRGGLFRSKAFRDLSYRHMEKAGMLEDHIAALRQLAETRPWLDLDRAGIFGGSGGGFAAAHAMIDYPDFFKVGVASAGNHEQRAYVHNYGATFHGPPDSTDFEKVFAGRDVSRFKGKLLLAHGDMDDNVHPAHTLRLVDALIKGNKQFDMLIIPNGGHGIPPYLNRIIQNYFLRHLMGAQLPSDSDIVLPGTASPVQQTTVSSP